MGAPWLPAAGLLLAAVLPLLPAYEDQGRSPDSEALLPLKPLVGSLAGLSASAGKSRGAPGAEGGVLPSEAAGDQTSALASPLSLKPHGDQLSPQGIAGAAGRASASPAPSAGAEPMAHRAPASWSSVRGPAEETWIPGSPETPATSPSQAPPGPRHLGVGPDPGEFPGLPMTAHVPASVMLRAFVASEPTGQLLGAPPVSPTPAHLSRAPQLLTWLKGSHPVGTRAWVHSMTGARWPLARAPGPPEKAVPSVPPGALVRTRAADTPAAAEPLPTAARGCSAEDKPSPSLTEDAGSPREAVASSLGPGPSSPLVLPLPSAAPPSRPPPPPPPSSPAFPLPALPSWSLSPSPSSPQPSSQSPATSPSPTLAPTSPFSTRARASPDSPRPERALTTTGVLGSVSSLPPALPARSAPGPASARRGAQPGALAPDRPALPLGCVSSPSSGFSSVPVGAGLARRSPPPPPGQPVSLQDSGPRHTTRSVAFRVTNEGFSETLRSPASLEHQLLSENIRGQLQPMYHADFPGFQGICVLLFRPGSVTVNASLVFGGRAPGPSTHDVLWTLYREVKTAGQRMGNLSLDEDSLASDGSYLTDLVQELISIHFTVMRPFLPQLLEPGSAPFVLLGEQILRQVTPVVSGFYKVQPQGRPLILFSDMDQWVGVSVEYKFQTPILIHLQGLANHLARTIMDPALQKSSIEANGEKAELVLYELWLQILGRPFTGALEDKISPESQELRGTLTRWLTVALSPLQNFGQVVVEGFQLDPLTANVEATFLGAAPSQALLQDCVHKGLRALREAEGFSVEVVEILVSDWGMPSSEVRNQRGISLPGYAVALIVLGLLLVGVTLVLVLKRRACCSLCARGPRSPACRAAPCQEA